jgi:hypothetical protein
MAATADAQPSPSRPGVELALGVSWTPAIALTTRDAVETSRSGGAYRLFAAESELRRSTAYFGRVAFPVNQRWRIETAFSYARPVLAVRVSADIEGAEDSEPTEQFQRFQVDGGVVALMGSAAPERRTVPFVTAGASYLREIHAGQTLAANGHGYFAGGGIRRRLMTRAGVETIGVRLEARAVVRARGLASDGRLHVAPAVSAALFLRF